MHSVIRESEIGYLCSMVFSQIWFIFMKVKLYWTTSYQLLPTVSQGFETFSNLWKHLPNINCFWIEPVSFY